MSMKVSYRNVYVGHVFRWVSLPLDAWTSIKKHKTLNFKPSTGFIVAPPAPQPWDLLTDLLISSLIVKSPTIKNILLMDRMSVKCEKKGPQTGFMFITWKTTRTMAKEIQQRDAGQAMKQPKCILHVELKCTICSDYYSQCCII